MRYKSIHAWSYASEKTQARVFFDSFKSFFAVRFVAKRYILQATAKVSERTNRNLPTRNTLVQLLALYTNPESQNAQRRRQTYRRTDRRTTGLRQ